MILTICGAGRLFYLLGIEEEKKKKEKKTS